VSTRAPLPQPGGDRLFVTDGGRETTLIFHEGIELPEFAAFPLLEMCPQLRVAGGCCGTDHRHVAEICVSLSPAD
jgi:S-methylmethionine-dependent homocysteine/selenocysteine methylase